MAVDQEELQEQQEAEEKERAAEYLDFRRKFDQMKSDHEGQLANCEKLKQQGNNFFKLGLFSQASMMYSEALELQPENAVLYCNRAMAYLKQDMAHEALEDSQRSLDIDSSVGNIKAFWRKSQSLYDLDRFAESEDVADEGLALQPGNQHLNRVRRKAREATTMRRLCGGEWVAKMENGVEKRYTFDADGSMKINVFGHFVPAAFELSVEGNPRSLVVKMKAEVVGFGNGPPPPPRPYIFDFRDNDKELWLCTPIGTDELPTTFEGPGFDRFRREVEPEANGEPEEPLDTRCEAYLRELVEAMPLLPPQLPETPSEQEICRETMITERISQLKRRFGVEVHLRAVELAKAPKLAPTPAMAELALQLQQRFVARKIMAPPAPEPVAPPQEKATEVAALAASPAAGCLGFIASLCCGGGVPGKAAR